MPIYEYRCQSCGHTLDALQKIADTPLKDCPECAAPALKRLMSAPAFRLKGGGWYETDFKSDKEKKRNLADGGGKDGSGTGASEAKKSSDGSNGSGTAKDSGSAKGDAGKSGKTKESSSGSSTEAA